MVVVSPPPPIRFNQDTNLSTTSSSSPLLISPFRNFYHLCFLSDSTERKKKICFCVGIREEQRISLAIMSSISLSNSLPITRLPLLTSLNQSLLPTSSSFSLPPLSNRRPSKLSQRIAASAVFSAPAGVNDSLPVSTYIKKKF